MKLSILLFCILCFFSCSQEEAESNYSFLGEWTILQAQADGEVQAGWEGMKWKITQTQAFQGTINVFEISTDIPLAGINTWETASGNKDSFLLNDSVYAEYSRSENQLQLKFFLGALGNCEDTENIACLLGLSGQWTFIAEAK